MAQEKRRKEILKLLTKAEGPLTGVWLSATLGVTRQIIVADVAVLRARGEEIIATPQGYLLPKISSSGTHRRTIAVHHGEDHAEIARELDLIVDLGGTVVDVTVEHPLYGEITANLQISSRSDVVQFISKLQEQRAEPLLVLTDGYHLHTIEAPTQEVMATIEQALRKTGYLAE